MGTHERTYNPRPLWIWVIAAAILDIAGAQHVYREQTVAAAALAGLALLWLLPAAGRSQAETPGAWLLPYLPIVALVAAMVDVATFVPPDSGWTANRLILLIGGIGVLLIAARRSAALVALAALLLGTAIRTIHMRYIPIDPVNGDMLPLVNGALSHLLAGSSPYRTYEMPWLVPLTYLPVTWLAYLPGWLIGIDLRWTNVAAEIAVGGALLWLSARRHGLRAALDREPALWLWAWLFLQPTIIHWDTGNTAPITWALLAITFALVLGRRPRAAAIGLGLTAAGSPLAAVFGPLIGLHWLRSYGLRRTIPLVAISAVVALIVVLPFALWAPNDFLNGAFRWFNTIDGWPRQKWLETDPHIWAVITGFSGEFWARGTERWLKPIQALIVVSVAVIYWWRGARADQLSTHAAAAYLGFMLFNPVLWPYLYNPALIVGLVGLIDPAAEQPVAVTQPDPSIQPILKKA